MGDFLAAPAFERLGEGVLGPQPLLEEGDRVAAYRIVRLIGSGGAGTVYEAEQTSPQRRVALKVMHGGIASEASLGRFLEEAEILARLAHPDIAHVYEAGVHEGTPWFTMELVSGAGTIVEYCAGLDVANRLRLFARVCDAIHHGHLKGVVHRDIKPANVLVHAPGVPKIIDFGIARVEGLGAAPREIVGTIPYMSPEQLAPGEDVDVRSDVYSLGVVLYELLSGGRPYEVSSTSISDATRVIREAPPPPLGGALRGDIDAIVRKALAKNREHRYASAAALADDIRRHLAHEPVAAVSGGLPYQALKFARRHRGAVAAIAAILLVSVVAAFVSGWLAVRSAREHRRAEYQTYVASIAAASAALRVNDVGEARLHLESAPRLHRNWEWRHLQSRLDLSARRYKPGPRIAVGVLSSDGEIFAVSHWRFSHEAPSVSVGSTATGEVRYTVSVTPGRVDALAFSPDRRWLVFGLLDGAVEIRDAKDGGLRLPIEGHQAKVTMVDFAPGGERFATSSYDSTVKIWETASGRH